MDKQRGSRAGVANAFFILRPHPDTSKELEAVQTEMKKLYTGIDSGCLMRPKTFHLTLVGAHVCCADDLELLRKSLESFSSFELQDDEAVLKGLGSWKTQGGMCCLFAELKIPESVVLLAVRLSEHLRAGCQASIDGCFGRGSWIDVVEEKIYQVITSLIVTVLFILEQPHVTLVSIDPRMDSDVWAAGRARMTQYQNFVF